MGKCQGRSETVWEEGGRSGGPGDASGEPEKRGWTVRGCGWGEAKRRRGGRKQLTEMHVFLWRGGESGAPRSPQRKEGVWRAGSGGDGMGVEVGPERG